MFRALFLSLLTTTAASAAEPNQAEAMALLGVEAPAEDATPLTPAEAEMEAYRAWMYKAPRLPYIEGGLVPSGYKVEKVVRKGEIVAGAVLLGSTYTAGTLVAALNQEIDGDQTLLPMYFPVVGPWASIALDSQSGDLSAGGAWGLGALGVSQAVGLGLMLHGAIAKRTVLQKRAFGLTSATVAPSAGGGVTAGVSGTW